jgi:hypothetical protein
MKHELRAINLKRRYRGQLLHATQREKQNKSKFKTYCSTFRIKGKGNTILVLNQVPCLEDVSTA